MLPEGDLVQRGTCFHRARHPAVLAAFALVLACGPQAAPAVSSDESASASGTSDASRRAAKSSVAPPGQSSPPPDGQRVSVRGTVSKGVEAGCLILEATTGVYQLIGAGSSRLRPGETVTVLGVVQTETMSFCQQGQPLHVLDVQAD